MSASPLSIQAAEYLKLWHTLFFLEIERLIRNPEDLASFDFERMADPKNCRIGRWLAAQDEQVRRLDELKAFDLAHQQFHTNVAVMLECLSAGVDTTRSDLGEALHVSNDRVAETVDQLIIKLRAIGALSAPELSGVVLRLWDPSFEVGHPEIDRQHRTIMTLIELAVPNRLPSCVGMSPEEIVHKLFRLIRSEIGVEIPIIERMLAAGIKSAENHREAHLELFGFIEAAKVTHMQPEEISAYLAQWYVEHLVIYDEELRDFCKTKYPTLEHHEWLA